MNIKLRLEVIPALQEVNDEAVDSTASGSPASETTAEAAAAANAESITNVLSPADREALEATVRTLKETKSAASQLDRTLERPKAVLDKLGERFEESRRTFEGLKNESQELLDEINELLKD